MGRNGLFIGEVAARSGVSRKALRLYESAGLLPAPRRTASGYRVYGGETLALLAFVAKARRLGFVLDEIREIVAIKRAGRLPCPHVRALARRKVADIEKKLAELAALRDALRALSGRRRGGRRDGAFCSHIEGLGKEKGNGRYQGVAVPGVQRVPRGRDRGRRSADR